MPPTLHWLSMQWTSCTAADSMASASYRPTVISPGLLRAYESRGWTFTASGSRRHRRVFAKPLLPGAAALDPDAAPPAKPLEPPNAAIPVLNRVISQMDSEDGWVDLATVGRRLSNLALDFDPRTYGFGKLSDLVRNHSKCIRALRSPPGWFCLGAIAPLSLFVACHAYREESSPEARL